MSSTIKVNAIEPEGASTTLTVGNSAGDIVIDADSIKSNVIKDSGGNAIFTSDGSGNISGANVAFGSAYKLLATATASDSASLDFGSSVIAAPYKEFIFRFHGLVPATDDVRFEFNSSGNNGSPYSALTNVTTMATTVTLEDGSSASHQYETGGDTNNTTDNAGLCHAVGNDSDQSCSGELQIQNPLSTTYHRMWHCRMVAMTHSDAVMDSWTSGYIYSGATAPNYFKFMFSSGNITSGTISVWGIE